LGNKQYEITNHLGNVLAVSTDRKLPYAPFGTANQAVIHSYYAQLISVTDYTAFGVALEGRTWSDEGYRYGFNGQEKDDEISGQGNITTAQYWEYDTRLGMRWNIDPQAKEYASAYSCFLGNPVYHTDVNGNVVEYERFGDKVNSFVARVFSGSYRRKFREWNSSAKTYTFRQRAHQSKLIHANATYSKTDERAYDVLYSTRGSGGSGEPVNETFHYTVTTYYTIEITVGGKESPKGGYSNSLTGEFGSVLSIEFNTYEQPDQISVLKDGAYVGGTENSEGKPDAVATKNPKYFLFRSGALKGQEKPYKNCDTDNRANEKGFVVLPIEDKSGVGKISIEYSTPETYQQLNVGYNDNSDNLYNNWKSKSQFSIIVKTMRIEHKTSSKSKKDITKHSKIKEKTNGGAKEH
jgi:hypothetical protein